jgi:radical SAM superfamily enzyme YgiQ (UPF0313 family)
MLGGHLVKAMPRAICADPDIPRVDALVVGEAEYRVEALLHDRERRRTLPGVFWRHAGQVVVGDGSDREMTWLSPDIDALPPPDRESLIDDPYHLDDGRLEAALVGSRGCPYNCSFCGAAKDANPDVAVRTRTPQHLVAEMRSIHRRYGVTSFRFVDDLFLAKRRQMVTCLEHFLWEGIPEWCRWRATGRINTLAKCDAATLDLLSSGGCYEVSLGIEAGSDRLLEYMNKRISVGMIRAVVEQLLQRGVDVKGYFILGFPTETRDEHVATERLVHDLWRLSDRYPGTFRASAFEFRPYPGTPEWNRLVRRGFSPDELMAYQHVDMTNAGDVVGLHSRDEFNFSVGHQFGEVDVVEVRSTVARLMLEQSHRTKQQRRWPT